MVFLIQQRCELPLATPSEAVVHLSGPAPAYARQSYPIPRKLKCVSGAVAITPPPFNSSDDCPISQSSFDMLSYQYNLLDGRKNAAREETRSGGVPSMLAFSMKNVLAGLCPAIRILRPVRADREDRLCVR